MDRTGLPSLELALVRMFSTVCLGVGWATFGLYLYASSCEGLPAYCIPEGTFPGYPFLGVAAFVAGTVMQWAVRVSTLDFFSRCFLGFAMGVSLGFLALIFGGLITGPTPV